MDFKFEVNEGPVDRAVRVVLGAVLALAAYMKFVSPPLDLLFYLLAIVLVITGAIGFCAIYKVFGINTNPKKS